MALENRDLKRIHNKVMRRYLNEKQANVDSAIAKDLERTFNDILLYFFKDRKTTALSPSQYNIISDLRAAGIPSNLFDFIGQSGYTDIEKGFIFEERLGLLIGELFNSNELLTVGDQSAYTKPLTLQQAQKLGLNVEIFNPQLNKWIVQKATEINDDPKTLVRYIGATGKVDLQIPNSTVTIKYDYANRIKKFLKQLQGRRISAKCYTDTTKVSLGKSGLFRTIYSVLSDIGEDEDTIRSAYYAFRPKKIIPERELHRSHIIFAYELMGMGQLKNLNGGLTKIGEVDFLIVFDKTTNSIIVRSTKDLARKYLQKKININNAKYIDLSKF